MPNPIMYTTIVCHFFCFGWMNFATKSFYIKRTETFICTNRPNKRRVLTNKSVLLQFFSLFSLFVCFCPQREKDTSFTVQNSKCKNDHFSFNLTDIKYFNCQLYFYLQHNLNVSQCNLENISAIFILLSFQNFNWSIHSYNN